MFIFITHGFDLSDYEGRRIEDKIVVTYGRSGGKKLDITNYHVQVEEYTISLHRHLLHQWTITSIQKNDEVLASILNDGFDTFPEESSILKSKEDYQKIFDKFIEFFQKNNLKIEISEQN